MTKGNFEDKKVKVWYWPDSCYHWGRCELKCEVLPSQRKTLYCSLFDPFLPFLCFFVFFQQCIVHYLIPFTISLFLWTSFLCFLSSLQSTLYCPSSTDSSMLSFKASFFFHFSVSTVLLIAQFSFSFLAFFSLWSISWWQTYSVKNVKEFQYICMYIHEGEQRTWNKLILGILHL